MQNQSAVHNHFFEALSCSCEYMCVHECMSYTIVVGLN